MVAASLSLRESCDSKEIALFISKGIVLFVFYPALVLQRRQARLKIARHVAETSKASRGVSAGKRSK